MRELFKANLFFAAMIIIVCANTAFADENFWQSPQKTLTTGHYSSDGGKALFANLASSEQVDIDGQVNRMQQFSVTRFVSPSSAFSLRYSHAGEQRNYVLGYQADNLTVSMLSGKGEDYAQLGGDYHAVDPHLFHGGYKQEFDVSGYAVDYGFGRFGHMQFGQATVSADGLLDRRARYFEWSNNRYFARASRFSRGDENIGNGLDFGVAFAGKRVAVQTMNLENDKRMQRIRLQFEGKQSRSYWLDLSAHQNPLYEANNDYRVMFNFRTLLGTRQLASYQNDQVESAEDVALEDESNPDGKKKKGGGWKRLALIGGGIAAAAALSSSGSGPTDSLTRFRSQNEAARDVLNEVNPQSIRVNREFGGWVFVNPDGSFGSSTPVQGQAASVRLPDPMLSVPQGSRITASYHTHAAFDPAFDNENFSPQDLQNDRDLNIDGYLATPLGQFKLHDIATDTVITLGTVATE